MSVIRRIQRMDAISLLTEEHRLILQVLDALDAFADQVGRGLDDRAELGRFARFVREYADARHHGKEEDILFEAMVEAGFPREAGPIAVMRLEHEAGRARLAVMAELAGLPGWTAEHRSRLLDAAHGYTELLRSHIRKEDTILYPMALQRLGPERLERVDRECRAFEERQQSAGGDALDRLAGELLARHLPATPR
jgi:hemerythrin-like domain-containing protein